MFRIGPQGTVFKQGPYIRGICVLCNLAACGLVFCIAGGYCINTTTHIGQDPLQDTHLQKKEAVLCAQRDRLMRLPERVVRRQRRGGQTGKLDLEDFKLSLFKVVQTDHSPNIYKLHRNNGSLLKPNFSFCSAPTHFRQSTRKFAELLLGEFFSPALQCEFELFKLDVHSHTPPPS